MGLEPMTLRFLVKVCSLKVWCSTDWANRAYGTDFELVTIIGLEGIDSVFSSLSPNEDEVDNNKAWALQWWRLFSWGKTYFMMFSLHLCACHMQSANLLCQLNWCLWSWAMIDRRGIVLNQLFVLLGSTWPLNTVELQIWIAFVIEYHKVLFWKQYMSKLCKTQGIRKYHVWSFLHISSVCKVMIYLP